MLKEVNQNTSMDISQPVTNQLAIHQTNLYRPHRLGAKLISASPNRLFLAAQRAYLDPKDINCPLSVLDFYNITSKSQPNYVHSIIEYEDITGIAWLDERYLIAVSRQATINIYNIKAGTKIKSMTTDYGPITSMKFSSSDSLLVTGTEYGYAVVYRVKSKDRTIECINKMVKTTEVIKAIDFHLKPRPIIPKKTSAPLKKPSVILGHSKRKKSDSSDESEDDEADGDESGSTTFLGTSELTIYGGHTNSVVAWDFHKTTIIDTIVVGTQICSILVLKNGNIVVGDSTGQLGIFDHITFTCRQSEQISESALLTLATNSKSSTILATGQEPVITLLKIDKTSEAKDEYLLFEKIKDHGEKINCSLFTGKKEFFTCADDNKIIKFKMSKSDGVRKMKRFTIFPMYRNKLHFCNCEVMGIFGKSMIIYKLSMNAQLAVEPVLPPPSRQTFTEPSRVSTIRASAYVHSAAIDEKWICFATSKGLKIIDRPDLSRVDTTTVNLGACHILKLCQSGRFLIAGQQKKLAIVKLDGSKELNDTPLNTEKIDESAGAPEDRAKSREQQVIYLEKLKGYIRDIVYLEPTNQLIVSCGTTSQFLYILRLPIDSSHGSKVEFIFRSSLPCSIMHIAHNIYNTNDSNLYIYTIKDQLIKCDTSDNSFKKDLGEKLSQQDKIRGLPRDISIQGVIVLNESKCLIYDTINIFKLDIEANEIINTTSDYADIITIDNTIFNKPGTILAVSTV